MGLKVWLPLNGDLTQQGASNISMINSNATVNASGKIGSCYYFNASSYLYENTYDWTNFNTSQFSLCCWYKQPSPVASGNSQIICIGTSSGWNNIRIGLLRRTSNGYPMFSVSNGSSAIQYDCTATTFSLDAWNHIVCTYDNGAIKIYLNGILNKTYTTTITPVLNSSQHLGVGAASNGAEKLTGYLNDVRIYDHCLSAAEVREISQGLVLHYKLDDITNGIQDSSGYGNNGIINSNPTISLETRRYNYSISFDGVDDCIKIPFNDIIKDKNYTVSVWTYKTSIGTKNYQTILGGPSGFELEARSSSSTSPLYRIHNWGGGTTAYEFNKWNLFTFVHTDSDSKLYVNGALKITGTSANIPTGNYYIGAWNSVTGQNYEGLMSDFRIYCTTLDADAIRQLYEVGAKVDNKQNLHAFEFAELNSGRELLAGPLTQPFSNHTAIYSGYDSNGEITLTGSSSVGSGYIKINPTGHTYYYDIDVSTDSGNVFYIGFEKYDINKTARSNNACVYLSGLAGSSEARTHKHYHGTVNLATDGVNPTDTIALRILNDWSGANGRKATIHRISLREVPSLQNSKINKKGQVITDELIELDGNCRIQKNGTIEANEIIEL